jgi:hypothetical protein
MLFITVLALACMLLSVPVSGRGIVPLGGKISIGLSAELIPDTPSRPLAPLSAVLLDETYETVFPTGSGVPLATWERIKPDGARLILKANIAAGGSASRVLTAQDIVSCWTKRSTERWDALWALRGFAGVEDAVPGIAGLQALDERTLTMSIRPGMDTGKLQKALTSPALKLALPDLPSSNNGTGPYIESSQGGNRETLDHSNVHHAGRAYIDQVDVLAYPSAEQSVVDFEHGKLNGLLITSSEQADLAKASPKAAGRVTKVGQAMLVLMMNPARMPFFEERKGLVMAADRNTMAHEIIGGDAIPSGDFYGGAPSSSEPAVTMDDANKLYLQAPEKRDKIVLLVCDDPSAIKAAGRLKYEWERMNVPVEIRTSEGPPMLSLEADAVLLALRIPNGGEGVLPACLALYDRSSWWEFAALVMGDPKATILRNVRALDPNTNIDDLGTAMIDSAVLVPLVKFDILFAPGNDYSMTPEFVYPGSTLWRVYRGAAE